jgi:hypothetical protein
MDLEDWRSESRRARQSANWGRGIVRNATLSGIAFCLACTHPLSGRSGTDAADVRPDGVVGPGSDAPADMAGTQPDEVDAAPDIAAGDFGPTVDSLDAPTDLPEAAIAPRDGSSSDGADAPALETGNPWLDSGWIIDGPCSDNPSNLMQVLATSLGSPFCSRTASSQPEGHIDFDSEGRVTIITGNRVPTDKEAWVDSLAAYRWPCLAGKIIAYGCSP